MSAHDESLTTADLASRAVAPEDAALDRDEDDGGGRATETDQLEPLLGGDESGRFRGEWEAIQVGFVDDPKTSVERADALVATLMQRLADTFAQERETLEQQWGSGDDRTDTEELRVALQRYRSFFERLLTT
jgi:hypothetical protein